MKRSNKVRMRKRKRNLARKRWRNDLKKAKNNDNPPKEFIVALIALAVQTAQFILNIFK